MSTITPVAPGVPVSTITPVVPSATDQIDARSYTVIFLVIASSTGTPTVTVTDQISAPPAGLAFSGQTVSSGALSAGQTKAMRLDCSRFRDVNGMIQIATATPANSTIYAIGV